MLLPLTTMMMMTTMTPMVILMVWKMSNVISCDDYCYCYCYQMMTMMMMSCRLFCRDLWTRHWRQLWPRMRMMTMMTRMTMMTTTTMTTLLDVARV
jgi:hypothetical protein